MTADKFIQENEALREQFEDKYKNLKKVPYKAKKGKIKDLGFRGTPMILRDGIYTPKDYFNGDKDRPKICIILKEANNGNGHGNGTPNDGSKSDWSPIPNQEYDNVLFGAVENIPAQAIVSAFEGCSKLVVKNGDGDFHQEYLKGYHLSNGYQDKYITGIGYVNIRKDKGGGESSDQTFIQDTLDNTADLIYKQLKLIDADTYIFGGTFLFFWDYYYKNTRVQIHQEYKKNLRLLFFTKNNDLNKNSKENDTIKVTNTNFVVYKLLDETKPKLLIQIRHPSQGGIKWWKNEYITDAIKEYKNGDYETYSYSDSAKKWILD